MVVSKRCKICTVIEPENMPISGEYFGKRIPEIIWKISGLELHSPKLVDVLICQQCAILLVHTESVVSKLRKCMLRLTKPANVSTKTKTPSKAVKTIDSTTPKKKNETLKEVGQKKTDGDVGFKKFRDTNATLDESVLNGAESTPGKKNAKRKLDDSQREGDGTGPTPNMATALRHLQQVQSSNGACNSFTELEAGVGNEKKRIKINSTSANEISPTTEEETDVNAMRDEHSLKTDKTKEVDCVLCGKKYNNKSSLREHIETSHMGEKLKECPNCSMEFRSSQKYDSHVFGEKCKGTLHPCQFDNCNRRFKNIYKMEKHMREKHLSLNDIEVE